MRVLHLVKVVHDDFEFKLDPIKWKEALVGRFERFSRPTRYLGFWLL